MAKEMFSLFTTAKTLRNNRGADFDLPDHGQFFTQRRLVMDKPLIGYILIFAITTVMLSRGVVSVFKKQATESAFVEKVALAAE